MERTLRDAILAGSLRDGVRLPASRALARELGVSRGVVSDAYAQLASQGFLIARTRAAPIVAARTAVASTPVDPPLTVRYDLTPRLPDIALFPLRRWLDLEHRVTREAGSAVLSYRDPRGERTLREALADHLGRTRGVIADPDEIFVTQGAGQSIDLVLRVLSARGAIRVALEDPSQVVLRKRVVARTGVETAAARPARPGRRRPRRRRRPGDAGAPVPHGFGAPWRAPARTARMGPGHRGPDHRERLRVGVPPRR